MEPIYSVFVYSKYSVNCKKAFDTVQNSGVDFSQLRLLCIDNQKVRERIMQNKQLDIRIVPCILSVFPNGGVEKFEGDVVFEWINSCIIRLSPPIQPRPQSPPQTRTVTSDEQPEEKPRERPRAQPRERLQERPRQPRSQPPDDSDNQPEEPRKIPPRMKRIDKEQPAGTGATPIDDLPMDDTDRHRIPQKPKRLQQGDSGEFIEDEDLFSGEPLDYRREPHNVIAQKAKSAPDPHGTRARAEEMARAREMTEEELNPKNGRPIHQRRP